jgi:Protein of unknown function (DUF1761)
MKLFAGLNTWMLPVAAIASFAFGAVWYMALSKPWMAAAGLSEEKIKQDPSPTPFIIAFIAQLFMAWMLAGLLLHMAKAGLPANLRNGLITALFVWAGFVMTTLIVNHRFQKQPWSLTLIDGGHWLGVLLLQGAILGLWGLS